MPVTIEDIFVLGVSIALCLVEVMRKARLQRDCVIPPPKSRRAKNSFVLPLAVNGH